MHAYIPINGTLSNSVDPDKVKKKRRNQNSHPKPGNGLGQKTSPGINGFNNVVFWKCKYKVFLEKTQRKILQLHMNHRPTKFNNHPILVFFRVGKLILFSLKWRDLSRTMTKQTKSHVRPANTQISLGIRPVWSESSLSAWRIIGSLATYWVHSEGSEQNGMIWVFAGQCSSIRTAATAATTTTTTTEWAATWQNQQCGCAPCED